jgi:hypothetical protein
MYLLTAWSARSAYETKTLNCGSGFETYFGALFPHILMYQVRSSGHPCVQIPIPSLVLTLLNSEHKGLAPRSKNVYAILRNGEVNLTA